MGYAQNIAQLESSFETNKKKRKADDAFSDDDFDYLYGIVTTGRFCYIARTDLTRKQWPYTIEFTDEALIGFGGISCIVQEREKGIRYIVALLKDRTCVEKSPATKRARV